ncbi:hypothetical protein AYY16_11155 [Morganella psychrotolerans]|nr:hypothetical protein AYY16_11155 [Morganella psychrotolerans]
MQEKEIRRGIMMTDSNDNNAKKEEGARHGNERASQLSSYYYLVEIFQPGSVGKFLHGEQKLLWGR